MVHTKNLAFYSGDDVTINSSAKDINGNDINVTTGASFSWKMAVDEYSAAIVTKTSGFDTAGSTSNAGYSFTIASSESAALDGVYYHEAQVTKASVTTTILKGYLTIIRDLA
ncbi:hypothetical protein LCGC14_0232110 [marine sediment metagenome]|uniref:Uncharacterized protein n=1 Tax=marine sediment metagenome TaxID=412755 RepID=A0A0F9XEA2_9ZZZZ